MLSVLKKSTYRHFIGKALFVIAVIAVAAAWNVLGPVPGWIIAAFFVFSLLAARFVARSKRQKYLCGAVALGAIVAGQAFFPLDFVILRHIIFNAPFLSAYLFPNIWPGIIISLVFAGLLTQAAINAAFPSPLSGKSLSALPCCPYCSTASPMCCAGSSKNAGNSASPTRN
jgi:hypothetical protein